MNSLRFTAESTSGGVVERDFLVGEIPGALWAPGSGPDHAPVVLLGHNGGMHKKAPGLRARALHTAATWGFTVVVTFVALAQRDPVVWVSYVPLLPLALLLVTGLYLFVLPYLVKRDKAGG